MRKALIFASNVVFATFGTNVALSAPERVVMAGPEIEVPDCLINSLGILWLFFNTDMSKMSEFRGLAKMAIPPIRNKDAEGIEKLLPWLDSSPHKTWFKLNYEAGALEFVARKPTPVDAADAAVKALLKDVGNPKNALDQTQEQGRNPTPIHLHFSLFEGGEEVKLSEKDLETYLELLSEQNRLRAVVLAAGANPHLTQTPPGDFTGNGSSGGVGYSSDVTKRGLITHVEQTHAEIRQTTGPDLKAELKRTASQVYRFDDKDTALTEMRTIVRDTLQAKPQAFSQLLLHAPPAAFDLIKLTFIDKIFTARQIIGLLDNPDAFAAVNSTKTIGESKHGPLFIKPLAQAINELLAKRTFDEATRTTLAEIPARYAEALMKRFKLSQVSAFDYKSATSAHLAVTWADLAMERILKDKTMATQWRMIIFHVESAINRGDIKFNAGTTDLLARVHERLFGGGGGGGGSLCHAAIKILVGG